MDMVGDRPKVVINKNKVQLLYNIIISKNNIEICIELNEIQYEGDDLIVSLQKENNKIKSSLSKLEKELFINKTHMLNLAIAQQIDFSSNRSGTLHNDTAISILKEGILLEYIDIPYLIKFIRQISSVVQHGYWIASNRKLYNNIQLLKNSMKISNMLLVSNNIYIQLLDELIGENSRKKNDLKDNINFDISKIFTFLIENGLSMAEPYKDGKTYYEFCNSMLHIDKYEKHSDFLSVFLNMV